MNKIFVPKIVFKNIVSDERRIVTAYSRLFEIARKNILEKRQLTNAMAQKYTEVQHGRQILNNIGSGQKITSE
ncbi:MAG: hypothetical protein ABH819_00625 [Patescibacteria group bacterium]